MTKSIKVKAINTPKTAKDDARTTQAPMLPLGTVVVHNYGEFAHGVVVGYAGDSYKVYFSSDMSPMVPKYQANTEEAHAARIRTITLGKGFFVSRFKSLDKVREAQIKYKNRGMGLE